MSLNVTLQVWRDCQASSEETSVAAVYLGPPS
jgi:hypothetical protein